MDTLSVSDYEALIASGKAIDFKHGYPKVILHPDSTVTKLWVNKFKLFSTSHFSPYAKRFITIAEKLKQAGIPVPHILQHANIEGTRVQLVRYRELPGRSIRDIIHQTPNDLNIQDLAAFYHQLHEQGILYRGMHFGNIILTKENTFGLIDFTDTTFYNKPVSMERRAANISTPLRYKEDATALTQAGLPSLVDSYLNVYQPNEDSKQKFLAIIERRSQR